VSASGTTAAARQITIGKLNPTVNVNTNVNLHAQADLAFLIPAYVFATPVFGGQFALQMLAVAGTNHATVDGTITAGVRDFTITRQGSIGDTTTAVGDLYPMATLRWNSGVNNFMIFVDGDIPVGQYSSSQLANIGIGHGAIDGGVGYTYFDEMAIMTSTAATPPCAFTCGSTKIPNVAPTLAAAAAKPPAEARILVGNSSGARAKVVAFGPAFMARLNKIKPANTSHTCAAAPPAASSGAT